MSERIAEVIELNLEKCPNSDNLSIQRVEGFQLIVRTDDWKDHKLAVFIRADEIVDTNRPEFSWLKQDGKEKHRVRTRKYLGMYYSHGILVPAPDGAKVGDNLYDQLGLEHYNPPEPGQSGPKFGGSGRNVKAPPIFSCLSKYDIENARGKYRNMFIEGESVWVQHKLNGSNMSVTFTDGKMHVHSRTMWPEEEETNAFWRALNAQPKLIEFCKERPDWLVYGELIGLLPKYPYDVPKGEVSFRIFDMKRADGSWLDSVDLVAACHFNHLLMAPTIGWMDYSFDKMCELAELPCPLGCKINEGIVVRPRRERFEPKYGRVIGKFVNPLYLEKG